MPALLRPVPRRPGSPGPLRCRFTLCAGTALLVSVRSLFYILLQAKQDFAPAGIAEREIRVTVGPTAVSELDESTVLAGLRKRNSEDLADGASRPIDAGLSESFVGDHRVGLPTKSQPRLRIEVKSRPDGNFALDTPYVPSRHFAGIGKSLEHIATGGGNLNRVMQRCGHH